MSKFNTYAQQLDAAFKTARGEYVEAYQCFQQAQQANCRANAWTPNESAAEKQVKTARAALALHDAEAAFTEASARVWGDFKTTRRMLRADLEQEVRAANLANPDAIDSNALELLKSGVLTSDDYAAFMEKYDSNPTMLKLLGTMPPKPPKLQTAAGKPRHSMRFPLTARAVRAPFCGHSMTFVKSLTIVIKIRELKFEWDKGNILKSKDAWVVMLSGILGAVIGAAFGGLTGGVIGLLLGVAIGIISVTWMDKLKNPGQAKEYCDTCSVRHHRGGAGRDVPEGLQAASSGFCSV